MNAQTVEKQRQIDVAVAGAKDTTILLAEKDQLAQKIATTNAKLKNVLAREAAAEALQAKISEAMQRIDVQQKKIVDSDAKGRELSAQLAEYARQQPMPAEMRTAIVDGLVKPILRGLGSCPIFAMKTLFRDDAVEVFSYFKLE